VLNQTGLNLYIYSDESNFLQKNQFVMVSPSEDIFILDLTKKYYFMNEKDYSTIGPIDFMKLSELDI